RSVSVEALAERFGVALQTVRRDVRLLAEAGLLARFHGGVRLPSSTTENVLDSSGSGVLNDDGTTQTITTDTTVLLANQPSIRVPGVTTNSTSVTNRWKLTGAYYTFRAGAMVLVPITSRLKATFSAGPALLYAGTNYSVTQTYTPETGADITDTSTSNTSHLLRPLHDEDRPRPPAGLPRRRDDPLLSEATDFSLKRPDVMSGLFCFLLFNPRRRPFAPAA
ncbi:MAG: DeoR family transcriptional regulator, partial [Verrucomicrobia bacterium]|nr:DeoR family transcriptional regulator [Verrucomicrobiota bacterium]